MPEWYRVERSEQESRVLIGFVGTIVLRQPPDLVLLQFADGRREVFRATDQLVAMDGPEEPWRSPQARPGWLKSEHPRWTHLPHELRNSRATHCQRNHPWDEANTIWETSKNKGKVHRTCRACKNLRRLVTLVKSELSGG